MANGDSLRKNRESPGFFMPGFSSAAARAASEMPNFRQKNGRLMRPEKSIDA